MRLFFTGSVPLLMLLTTQAFAVLLSYPVAQAPECIQSYENSPEPKLFSQVFAELHQICIDKGGIRVNSKEIYAGNSSEPIDTVLNCIGEHPGDYIMFSCTYSSFKD